VIFMTKSNLLKSTAFALCLACGAGFFTGCQSATNTAVQADAVIIPTGNAAMTAWAAYVNAGKATIGQINTVSNAYFLYYNAQLTASNAAVIYANNPTSTFGGALTNDLLLAQSSETNIIAIVSQLTK